MPNTLNGYKYAALVAQTGLVGATLNENEYKWLADQTGVSDIPLNSQWMLLLANLGYTEGTLNGRQLASWIDLGAPAGSTWNEAAYWFWADQAGVYGPSVQIQRNNDPGFCEYQPPITEFCAATETYTAIDRGFSGSALSYTWTVTGGNAIITGSNLGQTVTVETQNSTLTLPFNLKVVVSNLDPEQADRTTTFTQDHIDANVPPAYIGPNINDRDYQDGVAITPVETFNLFTGTNLVFTLEGTWPSGLVIDSATGEITGTPSDTLQEYPGIFIRVTNSKGTADSTQFSITLVSSATAPIFDNGPVPDQDWPIDQAIAQFPMGQYFVTGSFPRTYTIESGSLPSGLTMNAAGQINGTPTTDDETGSFQVRCTNAGGFAVSNVWNWFTWEAIALSTPFTDMTFVLNTPFSYDARDNITGTVTQWALIGTWPPGFAIDANGLITGTATTTAAYTNLLVGADNIYQTAFFSNSFNGTAGVAPVFSGTIANQTWVNGDPVSLDTSTYFGSPTGTLTYALATGSLPTSVTLNTSTGLISGTPLIASNATFSVSCTNGAGTATSNVVTWAVQAASTGPAFWALTPDTTNDYLMKGVLVGTGSLTTTHTSVLYAPDVNGVYQKFPANAPVWSGGRCVLTGAAGTDVVSVHGNESGGTPLAEVPYLQYYPSATNSLTYSRDLTNGVWTPTTMTVAKDAVGIDGVTNSACTLTATGANSTVIGSAITAASATHATCWYLKRKTGTGTIELTVDGGTTWQSVTLTSAYQKFTVDQATVTNPRIGIRLVTSGDAVYVGNAECYTARTIGQVRGLGPIFTTTAAVSTDRTVYGYPGVGTNLTSNLTQAVYYEHIFDFTTSLYNPSIWVQGVDGGGAGAYMHDLRAGWNRISVLLDTNGFGASSVTLYQENTVFNQTYYKVGVAMEEGGTGGININNSWLMTHSPVYGFYRSRNGTLLSMSTGITVMKIRNLMSYIATDYTDAANIIDGLMQP